MDLAGGRFDDFMRQLANAEARRAGLRREQAAAGRTPPRRVPRSSCCLARRQQSDDATLERETRAAEIAAAALRFAQAGRVVTGTTSDGARGPRAVLLPRRLALLARPFRAVGERRSSAHASRWRSIGTCASQHGTEQKTRAVRGRLHVDTLQAQYVAMNGSSFLQLEHTASRTMRRRP
jgi:hypothetical protein